MTDHVPSGEIEQIVGAPRHPSIHYGRAASADQAVYILHSGVCKQQVPDLRECPFSLALDKGISTDVWDRFQDMAVELAILSDGTLAPLCVAR
ncbi:uncharacterized protein RMCC_5779 [Mycolicibacterium canariasense]|uniref:Uncharacterized protein n=1 Tax=Mycolicibacterium canariasense TaxID=228230 RepID=A0A100WJ26_MYCCR|nr:hypothetical protein [Mycolicibacterium canariasense]MCV7210166.1 hypothetical protein [Mycolicibacterium canariasense]ORU97870.1 hypothetical protein AWB94_29400 [Mycolicibacterium canariasense]GAS98814.1 uncharacterized protein RMCC_5779 [Mycolicibacterium canariasense]